MRRVAVLTLVMIVTAACGGEEEVSGWGLSAKGELAEPGEREQSANISFDGHRQLIADEAIITYDATSKAVTVANQATGEKVVFAKAGVQSSAFSPEGKAWLVRVAERVVVDSRQQLCSGIHESEMVACWLDDYYPQVERLPYDQLVHYTATVCVVAACTMAVGTSVPGLQGVVFASFGVVGTCIAGLIHMMG